jgi:hypothetical protein
MNVDEPARERDSSSQSTEWAIAAFLLFVLIAVQGLGA